MSTFVTLYVIQWVVAIGVLITPRFDWELKKLCLLAAIIPCIGLMLVIQVRYILADVFNLRKQKKSADAWGDRIKGRFAATSFEGTKASGAGSSKTGRDNPFAGSAGSGNSSAQGGNPFASKSSAKGDDKPSGGGNNPFLNS